MITIKWTGKAVSVNKWHMVRAGRIFASPEYEKFIDSIAFTIKATAGNTKYDKISLIIHVNINNRMDHHNLIKPICDGIQRSGIIDDDKNIGYVSLLPAERHSQVKLDEIIIMIREDK